MKLIQLIYGIRFIILITIPFKRFFSWKESRLVYFFKNVDVFNYFKGYLGRVCFLFLE